MFWYKIAHFFFRGIKKIERTAYQRIAIASGMSLGSGTKLVGMQSYGSEPYLIEIGNECLITDGVKFITHDGSIQVPLITEGRSINDVYGKKSTFDRIKVGNNVFIGVNSIILPGTDIGDNSIIAAGSIVKGHFQAGVVIGGNPAKVISTIETYANKNAGRILSLSSNKERRAQIEEQLAK